MSDTKKRIFKSVYEITFSALTVIVGALFIWQTWSMYLSAGNSPAYTVKRIGEYFSPISAPVFCWLVALFGNVLLHWIFPDPAQKVKAYIQPRKKLGKLQARLPKEAQPTKAKHLEILQLIFWCVSFALCIFTAILSLVRLFDADYIPKRTSEFFTENGAAADRLLFILLLSLACAVAIIVASCIEAIATKKQISLMQNAIVENKKNLIIPQKKTCKCKKAIENFLDKKAFVLTVRIVIAVVGVGLFVFGIFNGGMLSVLDKAIKICTQCIGLG